MEDRCQHYSKVDEGWYCWKCLEQQRTQIIEDLKKWNESGFMSDCLGEGNWNELIEIVKGEKQPEEEK